MPRRNRNPGQAQATHRLDRFSKWAEKIIAENERKPLQRTIFDTKKGGSNSE